MRGITITSCAAVAVLAVAGYSAPSGAATPKSALKILKDAGIDAAVLKGSESEHKLPASLIEAAKGEGTIKMRLNMSPKLYRKVMKPFKERYPFVKTEYTRGVGAGRAVKPLAAFKTGRYIADVISSFGSSIEGFLASNALENIGDLPSFKNVPDQMKNANGLWAGFQMANWCMSYNKNRIKKSELPKTWWDLVDKNSGLTGGRVGSANRAHLWLLNLWGHEDYGPKAIKEKFLPAFFGVLKPQLRKEGINGMMKLAALGEFDVSMPSALYRIKIQVAKGAPLGAHCPEPVPQYFTAIGIFKNSPRVNTAKLFVNWLLSREGQLVQYAVIGSAPIHKELQDPRYFAYGEELKGKKVALRTIDLLINELPKVYKAWRPAWSQYGGKKGRN